MPLNILNKAFSHHLECKRRCNFGQITGSQHYSLQLECQKTVYFSYCYSCLKRMQSLTIHNMSYKYSQTTKKAWKRRANSRKGEEYTRRLGYFWRRTEGRWKCRGRGEDCSCCDSFQTGRRPIQGNTVTSSCWKLL